jgi:hypothetical protein
MKLSLFSASLFFGKIRRRRRSYKLAEWWWNKYQRNAFSKFTLKMYFVDLSFIIIWKCMVQAAKLLSDSELRENRLSERHTYGCAYHSSSTFLLPYLHWIPYNRAAHNAAKHLWVPQKSAQKTPYFSYRSKWNSIYAYTVKPYTYFQSRSTEHLGKVSVLSHGIAFEIVLQDWEILRNLIILTWILRKTLNDR